MTEKNETVKVLCLCGGCGTKAVILVPPGRDLPTERRCPKCAVEFLKPVDAEWDPRRAEGVPVYAEVPVGKEKVLERRKRFVDQKWPILARTYATKEAALRDLFKGQEDEDALLAMVEGPDVKKL